ncbi:MAG: pentapeptide repeat-containing protein [Microbacterium sp.]|jgi:uncharacterized protein YjbI with pentapeptide repeats|nr:pentapeptide repeat-containing protein [Microbacterium sp.]
MARTSRPLRPPQAASPDLPEQFEAGPRPRRGIALEEVEWADPRGEFDAPYADLSGSRFSGGALDRLDAAHGSLRDLDFDTVQIASLALRGAHLRRVRIRSSRIGSLDLADAEVSELIIEDCRIDYLSAGRASAADIDVSRTVFGSLDAPAASLTRVRFVDSRVDELDLREARNTDVDLRGLDVSHHLDPRGLAGATITSLQAQLAAASLATALGVQVRD